MKASVSPPLGSSCIKVYLCSNPTDSVLERATLRQQVFPDLRKRCRSTLGLDFRVIDPYESSDPSHWPDQSVRQQLIRECRENSAGPFLLALVGHLYGQRHLPAHVEASQFRLLLEESQRAGICTRILEASYHRDENTIPPSYRLSTAPAAGKEEDGGVAKAFQTAVHLCVLKGRLSAADALGFSQSAMDADLRFALDGCPSNGITRRCLVYVHRVENAVGEMTAAVAAAGKPHNKVNVSQAASDAELLSGLCNHFLRELVASCNLLVYTTTTRCNRRHGYTSARRRGYSHSLSVQVHTNMAMLIDSLQHPGKDEEKEEEEEEELQESLAGFYLITRPEEEEVRAYLQQKEHQQRPLVVEGGPCSGKTVLLAYCAQQVRRWLAGREPVVVAHLRVRPLAGTAVDPLVSLARRICRGYGARSRDSVVAPSPAVHLSSLLSSLPSPQRPLVLILDAVGQTDILSSFTSPLPPEVKLLLAASPGAARALGCTCVELQPADRKQTAAMLALQLGSSGRKVTSGQQALVNKALASCSSPLFARLLRFHAAQWHSDTEISDSLLPTGVHASITALLQLLEQRHAPSLTGPTLCFLSLSWAGLTEGELTDLLSSTAWASAPPLQMEVEMLLLDLRSFLIRRGTATRRVLAWASRHFGLVVVRRYLESEEERRGLHSKMAEYFSRGLVCAEPDSDAQTPPLIFDTSQLAELLHHLREGEEVELKHRLLASFRFHQAMVHANLLAPLLSLLREAGLPVAFPLLASIMESSACLLRGSPPLLAQVMEAGLRPYLDLHPLLQDYIDQIGDIMEARGHSLRTAIPPAPAVVPAIWRLSLGGAGSSMTEATMADGGVIAEVMDDGSVWVRKGPGGHLVRLQPDAKPEGAEFAAVKGSGQWLLFATRCRKLLLWDVIGPQILRPVHGHLASASATLAGFAAGGGRLCVWSAGESVVSVFDASGQALADLPCGSVITCVTCSADGMHVYCGQDNGCVSVFDGQSGAPLGVCSNPDHAVARSIVLLEARREMACVGGAGGVAVWDMAANTGVPALLKATSPVEEAGDFCGVDLNAERRMLLVSQSGLVTLWDTSQWEAAACFLAPRGRAFTHAVVSQDGCFFLAVLEGCPLVLLWCVSSGRCVMSLDSSAQPLALLTLGSEVVCVTADGGVLAWDSEMLHVGAAAPKMVSGVTHVAVDQAGRWFYTADGSCTVWRWSIATGRPNAHFLHYSGVDKVQLSPDGVHLVVLAAGELYIWKTTGCRNVLRIGGGETTDVLITPNGNLGVSVSERGLSRVWKMESGAVVCSIRPHLSHAQVSPEGTFLIGCRGGELLAASLWSGNISRRFATSNSTDHVLAFSASTKHPDLVVVLVASGDVYTWKVSEETVCCHFLLPTAFACRPCDFQMTSDGGVALLSTYDGVITLLDLTRSRLCALNPLGHVIRARLDPRGFYVAYIWQRRCACPQHTAAPELTVVRLADGTRIGNVVLRGNPVSLVLCERRRVFVGFEDGSVGVYAIWDSDSDEREEGSTPLLPPPLKDCPLDQETLIRSPLSAANVTWI